MDFLLPLIERFGLLGATGIVFGLVFYRYINGTLDDRNRISKGYDFNQGEVVNLRKGNDSLRSELLETKIELERERGLRTLLEQQRQYAVDGFLDETHDFERELKAERAQVAKLSQENVDLEERLNDCGNTITILQNIIKQHATETKKDGSSTIEQDSFDTSEKDK